MEWLLAGGIIGTLAAVWGHIKTVWSQISSLIIVSINLQGATVDAALVYLQDNFKQAPIGPKTYTGAWMYVKIVYRIQLVAWRISGRMGSLYFYKRKPLWVSHGEVGGESKSEYTSLSPSVLKISFIRGMFNADDFVRDAVNHYNQIRDNILSTERKRHFIRRIYGLSKKRAMSPHTNDKAVESKQEDDYLDYRGAAPIGWALNDIGIATDHSLDALALSPLVEEAVLEARRWKMSEQWYKEHNLQWRRGWLLYGRPGAGKTALARALAEELDLPVYIYDLASLANDEFQSAWRQMLSSVPCIALVEDIDSVFDGRKTVIGDLTFDCFLNCLDGIERADGLFTIITTNNPDKLDPALGIADDIGRSTRPGRVDRAILMDCPDRKGRFKIAKRILAEYPSFWEQIVDDGNGETGAQFQERCAALALKLYWTDKKEGKAQNG